MSGPSDIFTPTVVISVFSTLVTVTIAGVAVLIAYQQWAVNKATLREKLFDRRFIVFRETQAFLSEIFREAKFSEASFLSFSDTCQRARFLFGKPMHGYLEEVRRRAGKMSLLHVQLKIMPVGEQRNNTSDLAHNELMWLIDQLKSIFDRFEPYLGFEKDK